MQWMKAQDWSRPSMDTGKVQAQVAAILVDIEQQGSAAIDRYSLQWDGLLPQKIELLAFEEYALAPALSAALKTAALRIERYAQAQRASLRDLHFEDEYGAYGHRCLPIENIAAYIPAGRFPLLSSALMTLLPARVAGCTQRIALTPSDHPAVLATIALSGATECWRMGGAQAIAAAAYGYRNVSAQLPAADMIVGPGNAFVAAAKALLQTRVRIDTHAGPSEMLALCDAAAPADWIALDALAQAEHDPQALAVLVCTDESWLQKVQDRLQASAAGQQALRNAQIQLVWASDENAAIALARRMAPEHVQLCHGKIALTDLPQAGAVFVGARSPVALGDYLSGPNHTLPTMGAARRSGGLSVLDFLRVQSWQHMNEKAADLYAAAAELATAEGLSFHTCSLRERVSACSQQVCR